MDPRVARLRVDRLHLELPPAALRQAPHVVVENLEPPQAMGLRFHLAPRVGRPVAGIEEKLSVSFFAKRALDGKVIVEEKVARHRIIGTPSTLHSPVASSTSIGT